MITNTPLQITESELIESFKLMVRYGGGFTRFLAQAWFRADSNNRAKIEENWPELIENYHKLNTAKSPTKTTALT